MVAAMAEGGVELAFGMVNDDQFGPVVMVCAGGVNIELLNDRRFIAAPFSEQDALRHIQGLDIHKLLAGFRGQPPGRIDSAARALSRLSVLSWTLRDQIAEIDVNPVIVTPRGCCVVDALVIAKG